MSKKKQFVQENVPLSPPVFYILLSLATKERHGYDIMKQVEADSHQKVKLGAGTLYGAIKRMLDEKLIVEIDSPHIRRKYYQLTGKGRSLFINELQRYNDVVELAKRENVFGVSIEKRLAIAYV